MRIIPRLAAHRDTKRLLCTAPAAVGLPGWFDDAPDVEFSETGSLQMGGKALYRELTKVLRRFGPDVIYVPVERRFRFEGVPVVQMVQNMEPMVSPFRGNPLKERMKNFLRRLNAKRALREADRVIAVSEFVRDFITGQWKIPRERTGLIYHGLDDTGNIRPGLAPPDSLRIARQGLIFTAGSVRPARGLEDLISALDSLRQNNGRAPVLAIAGNSGPEMARYQNRLMGWADGLGLSEHVLWVGQLDEAQMKWHYAHCTAFVMTSRVESFGHTGGEALSHGCVCIAADNPCLPEIFGDAALYYQPGNREALAEAIEEAMSLDDADRVLLSQKARQRAGLFSWDVCAERTVGELKKAVHGR